MLFTICRSYVQKNIDENWETAIEYNPEAFGRVVGLKFLFCGLVVELSGNPVLHVMMVMLRNCHAQIMLYVDMEVNGVPLKVVNNLTPFPWILETYFPSHFAGQFPGAAAKICSLWSLGI